MELADWSIQKKQMEGKERLQESAHDNEGTKTN